MDETDRRIFGIISRILGQIWNDPRGGGELIWPFLYISVQRVPSGVSYFLNASVRSLTGVFFFNET